MRLLPSSLITPPPTAETWGTRQTSNRLQMADWTEVQAVQEKEEEGKEKRKKTKKKIKL